MGEMKFVFDYDSTLIQSESLEDLAAVALEDNPQKEEILSEIQKLTDLAMNGEMSYEESLSKRLKLLKANKEHVKKAADLIKNKITPSVERNAEFFQKNSEDIFVISSGFDELVVPITEELGIKRKNVFSNTFQYDERGNIVGCDTNNILSKDQGKAKQLDSLKLKGKVQVIGDGVTDYEMKSKGKAEAFLVFTENKKRTNAVKKSDYVIPTLEEFLYINQLPRKIYYPKNRISVLMLENINPKAKKFFEDEGYQIEIISGSLSEEELAEKIKNVSILGIRSKTKITRKVLEKARRLLAIGAFCIGTNQLDLEACAEKGIVVFNAPFGNTRSVAELVIGEMITLSRRTFYHSTNIHNQVWEKSVEGSYELRGKKLGIIGFGNIGVQVAIMAEFLGINVCYYDIAEKLAPGNVKKCDTMRELLENSDFVTVHVDGRNENTNLIGEKEFEMMKKGSIFLNLSRGFVVDQEALAKNIKNGKIRGAAIDVYPEEPKKNRNGFKTVLQGLPNVILTPHVGGSTLEAQENIADYVPEKLINFINIGTSQGSVNFPNLHLTPVKNAHRIIHIHKNIPGVLNEINKIFAHNNINVVAQYLKTNDQVGYVITDIEENQGKKIVKSLKEIKGTIKIRMLY